MSGIVGHMMYALLAAEVAARRGLPVAALIERHRASYLCGAYLGCDVQTLPAAICLDTGAEVGYGGLPLARSPLTGGPVTPWTLTFDGTSYTPRDIHTLFYGRAHLVFGFKEDAAALRVPWERLPEYGGTALADAVTLFGPGERHVAYLLGWLTHVVGDSLIKSFQPGLDLYLLNGTYTPENRPIQDLFTFHVIGRQERGLDWRASMMAMAGSPVEPAQLHYMRVGPPRGRLAQAFPAGWLPEREGLLRAVLSENRRYLRTLNERWLDEMALRPAPDGPVCHPELQHQTGGLTFDAMIDLAEQSGFRRTLWQIAETIADLFAAATRRQQELLA